MTPKCTFGPKSTLFVQNAVFEPPKRVLGSKMLFGEKGARCLHLFCDRCRAKRRVQNGGLYEKSKNAKVKTEKSDFDSESYICVKFIIKIINSALRTKQ